MNCSNCKAENETQVRRACPYARNRALPPAYASPNARCDRRHDSHLRHGAGPAS
jgi:hypothetical protein